MDIPTPSWLNKPGPVVIAWNDAYGHLTDASGYATAYPAGVELVTDTSRIFIPWHRIAMIRDMSAAS